MTGINDKILQQVGHTIRRRRKDLSYSQRDVAYMTGLTINMISTFENGKGATLHNFLLICRSLRIHPAAAFQFDLPLDPLYQLPPQSKQKIENSKKLHDLVYNSDFFNSPKRVAEVIEELDSDKSESNKYSVYLSTFCKEGALEYVKEGKVKKYLKKFQ